MARRKGLRLLEQWEGAVIGDWLEKLICFRDNDAYKGYDVVGYWYLSDPDVIQEELLYATNRWMRARSSIDAWGQFLEPADIGIADIPRTADLVDSEDAQCEIALSALGACVEKVASVKGITDMAATKMLYLKRPRLVAISDSYVRRLLGVPDLDPRCGRGQACAQRAIHTARKVRAVGLANESLLGDLQQQLTREGMPISKARIIDILTWAEEAIKPGGAWHETAQKKKWKPVT